MTRWKMQSSSRVIVKCFLFSVRTIEVFINIEAVLSKLSSSMQMTINIYLCTMKNILLIFIILSLSMNKIRSRHQFTSHILFIQDDEINDWIACRCRIFGSGTSNQNIYVTLELKMRPAEKTAIWDYNWIKFNCESGTISIHNELYNLFVCHTHNTHTHTRTNWLSNQTIRSHFFGWKCDFSK